MKDVKTTALGLLVGVGVFGLAAAPALAVEPETKKRFDASVVGKTISETEPVGVKGVSTEKAHWVLGNYVVNCQKAVTVGKVTEPLSKELKITVHFKFCANLAKEGTETIKLAAKFSTSGLTLIYHANGWAEIFENELGGEVPFTERTEIKMLPIAATLTIPGSKVCTITLPEQDVPARAKKEPEKGFSAAQYSNEEVKNSNKKLFPSGMQEKMLIENEFHKLKYVFTGGQCSANKEQGTMGSFDGGFKESIPTGNIGITTVE